MKPHPISALLLSLALTLPALAEPARTFLPQALEIPEFTPPPPPRDEPVPQMRVEASITRPSGASTFTILRGEPSTYPDLPPPPEPAPQREARFLTPEQKARAEKERKLRLQIGATIYDHRISRVLWNHPDTGEPHEAILGLDVGLLEGIGSFVRDNETHSLLLFHSHISTEAPRGIGRDFRLPVPEVEENSILFLRGDPDDPVGAAPILILRDLILAEKPRLTAYQQALRRHRQAAAAWHKAHPVPPRPHTVWLRPHRGSRYLKRKHRKRKHEIPSSKSETKKCASSPPASDPISSSPRKFGVVGPISACGFFLSAFLLLASCLFLPAQPYVNGIGQQNEILVVPTGEKFLRWFGVQGRTYFLQVSDPNEIAEPLRDWTWAPVIESGNDEEISYDIGSTSSKVFYRLHYTDTPLPPGISLEEWDADGDGLSNIDEITLFNTNPLNPDTDGDGMSDGWEVTFSNQLLDAWGVTGAQPGDPMPPGLPTHVNQEIFNELLRGNIRPLFDPTGEGVTAAQHYQNQPPGGVPGGVADPAAVSQIEWQYRYYRGEGWAGEYTIEEETMSYADGSFAGHEGEGHTPMTLNLAANVPWFESKLASMSWRKGPTNTHEALNFGRPMEQATDDRIPLHWVFPYSPYTPFEAGKRHAQSNDENGNNYSGNFRQVRFKVWRQAVSPTPARVTFLQIIESGENNVGAVDPPEFEVIEAVIPAGQLGSDWVDYSVPAPASGRWNGSRSLLPLDAKEVWSDQIAGVEANGYPDKTGQSEYSFILIGATSDNNFRVKIKLVSEVPEAVRSQVLFRWAYEEASGEYSPESGTSAFQDAKTVILNTSFDASNGPDRFLVAGIDKNSNGQLDSDEEKILLKTQHIKSSQTTVIPYKFIPVTQSDYNAKKAQLLGWATSAPASLEDAAAHLAAFCNGTIPVFSGNQPTTIPRNEPGLSHPVGVAFTPTDSPGTSFTALISKDHRLSEKVVNSNAMRAWLASEFEAINEEIRKDIVQRREDGWVEDLHYVLAPQNESMAFSIADPDLLLCLGRVKFVDAIIDFRVNMHGYVDVKMYGYVEDLYDFDYGGGISMGLAARPASMIQAGFPTLGNGGKVFKTRVNLGGHNPYAHPDITPYCFY